MIDPRLVLFAAASLLFGSLIVAEFTVGTEDGVPIAPALARRDAGGSKFWSPPPPIDPLVATILARPLFSPDRRPFAAPQSAGVDFKDKRFAGIVIAPDRRLAIFAVAGAKPVVASEGEIVDGWRIESITADEVALVSAQGSRTLRPVPAPASEGRTPLRKVAGRPGAAAKQNAGAEASQSDPKSAAAGARSTARTASGSGAPLPTPAQAGPASQLPHPPQPARASPPVSPAPASPRFTQPAPESYRGSQPLPTAGTAGQRQ
jgi:hypothetical protein